MLDVGLHQEEIRGSQTPLQILKIGEDYNISQNLWKVDMGSSYLEQKEQEKRKRHRESVRRRHSSDIGTCICAECVSPDHTGVGMGLCAECVAQNHQKKPLFSLGL
jgi:hypothetical protein